jgi:TetR/AcrR family transcriptional repressor of lmrAB and yxaGH operons
LGKARIHRDNLVAAAVRLFRRQGYASTGLQQILLESGAPKGSLYHYFPAGKEAVGEAAVELAGRLVAETLEALAAEHADPGAFVEAWFSQYADWMAASDYGSGCPIATTLLETAPRSRPITAAGLLAVERWAGIVARVLARTGMPPDRARDHARRAIAALEGALILARIEQSREPLEGMGRWLAGVLAADL